MRKTQKAALVAAMLGSLGFVGAGTAVAHGERDADIDVTQSGTCRSHDLNFDLLGNLGGLNGMYGNLLGGEGNPGAQFTRLGSVQHCDVSVG